MRSALTAKLRFKPSLSAEAHTGAARDTMGAVMREFLVSNGVPGSVIRVDERATTTRENALFVKELLAASSGVPVLLTSDFHMFRARRVFERAGVPVSPRPIPDVLKRSNSIVNRWTCFWTLAIETSKIAYYAFQRWL